MRNILRAVIALSLFAASSARAVQGYILGPTISTTTGLATENIAGVLNIAASSATISTPTITLTGSGGSISATTIQFKGPTPYYDIMAYGAKCDGSTDDFAAWTAVSALIGNGPAVIKFPAGKNCVFSKTIQLFPNGNHISNVWFDARGSTITSTASDVALMFGTNTWHSGDSLGDSGIIGGEWMSETAKTIFYIDGFETFNNTFRDMNVLSNHTRTAGDNSTGICFMDVKHGSGSGSYTNVFQNIQVASLDVGVSLGFDFNNQSRVTGDAPNGQVFENVRPANFQTYGVYIATSSYNRFSGNFFNAGGSAKADVFLTTTTGHNFFESQNESGAEYGYIVSSGSTQNHFKVWISAGYGSGTKSFVDRNSSLDSGVRAQSPYNILEWVDNPSSNIGALIGAQTLRIQEVYGFGGHDLSILPGTNSNFRIRDENNNTVFLMDSLGYGITLTPSSFTVSGSNYASILSAFMTPSSTTINGSTLVVGGSGLYSRTMAQLLAISPKRGEQYYCSDCSPAKVVVATGTSAGNFADAIGGVFK